MRNARGVTVWLVWLAACVGPAPKPCTECAGKCTDTQVDSANCGACGFACGTGFVCRAGTCEVSCNTPRTVCSAECVDPQTDNRHCGSCGRACAAGQSCRSGRCESVCEAPLTSCGTACADTRNDPMNCGQCGRVCAPSHATVALCSAGSCGYGACEPGHGDCDGNRANGCETPTQSDLLNCGACGAQCAPLNVRALGGDGGSMTTCQSADAGEVCLSPFGPACGAGRCFFQECVPGYFDLDGRPENGCELNRPSRIFPAPDSLANTSHHAAPRPLTYTIASEYGPGTVRYTLDGTDPSLPGARSAALPARIPVSPSDGGFVYLRWFVSYPDGRREANERVLSQSVQASQQLNTGMVLEDLSFFGGGPIAVVDAGSQVSLTLRRQHWVAGPGGFCATCAQEATWGCDGVGRLSCEPSASAGVFPGNTATQTHAFTAPRDAGTYLLRQGIGLNGCGLSGYPPINNGETNWNVGLLIVR